MNLVASPFVASCLRCICLLILWYYQLHSHMWTVTCSAVIHSGWLAHSDTVHSDTQWYMWTCSTVIHSGWLVHAPAVSGGNGQCQPVFSLPLMSLSHDIQYHSYHISSYIFSITSQIFLDMSLNSKIQIKHFTKRFWKPLCWLSAFGNTFGRRSQEKEIALFSFQFEGSLFLFSFHNLKGWNLFPNPLKPMKACFLIVVMLLLGRQFARSHLPPRFHIYCVIVIWHYRTYPLFPFRNFLDIPLYLYLHYPNQKYLLNKV